MISEIDATESRYRIELLKEMEKQFDEKNQQYFKNLLTHHDVVIRTRCICILADIGGKDAIEHISQVLTNDKDALVRHEAAVALGVIGSEEARESLNKALKDKNEEVRESAIIALANLDYISTMKRNNQFTRMTGG